MELTHTTKRNNSVQNEKKPERGLTLYLFKIQVYYEMAS